MTASKKYRVAISTDKGIIEFLTSSPAGFLMMSRKLIIENSFKNRYRRIWYSIYVQWPCRNWAQLQIRHKLQMAMVSIKSTKSDAVIIFNEIEDELRAVSLINDFIGNDINDMLKNKPKLEIVK